MIRLCGFCNAEFSPQPFEVKRGRGVYCSYSCAQRGASRERRRYYQETHVGKRFGRLTAQKVVIFKRGTTSVIGLQCICDCGVKCTAQASEIDTWRGRRSCGCLWIEKVTRHGWCGTPEYMVFRSMHARCANPNNKAYHRYGGRGIKVCRRWKKFAHFLADMGPRPKGYVLDRKNNNKGYCKSNCRWVTTLESARNRRNTLRVKIGRESKTVGQWSELTGVSMGLIYNRLRRGVSGKDLLRKV